MPISLVEQKASQFVHSYIFFVYFDAISLVEQRAKFTQDQDCHIFIAEFSTLSKASPE